MKVDELPTPASPNRTRRSAAQGWLRALELTASIGNDPSLVLPVVIDELAERFGAAPALLSDGERLSYRALAQRSHQYARWALAQGVACGDTVALLMPNRPEYMAIWLGVTSIGGVVALLNPNLTGASQAHCITAVTPKHAIVAADLHDAFAGAAPRLAVLPRVWSHGGGAVPRIDLDVAKRSGAPLAAHERQPVAVADRALLIFTSGTTGLPKAAAVSHRRLMQWSFWFAGLMGTRADDRMYNCLPMHHSVGGVAAIGSVLVSGGSVVLREKFSARRFWDDIVAWDCSLFQYIGELCRYLLNAPPGVAERRHRLRLCCGNGLRPDVWEGFQRRFRIPQILEFYAATEGNFQLYNVEGKPGAIGRIPSFLAHRFPAAIVRFDVETGGPARNADGRCIRCAGDEVGEAIGKIAEGGAASSGRFEGYTSAVETEKKILRNVFADGDAWFRTGDLMRQDEKGFFYFVDRVGDTFRWKGENVATLEVAEAICACPGIIDAKVYGVSVPGAEGRAGMAALVIDPGLDLADLRAHLAARLPRYARPLFLRLRHTLEVTDTFKHKPQQLVRDGFDPAAVDDPLYFDDRDRAAYVPLDDALHKRILAGAARL